MQAHSAANQQQQANERQQAVVESSLALSLLLTASCILCFTSTGAPAATPVEVEKIAGATLLIDAPRAKVGFAIQLADVLTITVQIDGAKTLLVQPPEKITKSPGWRIIRMTQAATTERADKRATWRQSYTFEPLAPGALTLALEPFVTSDKGTAMHKLTWRPLLIGVRTSIAAPEITDLRDPVVIEKLPPPEEADRWPWFALGAGLLAVVLSALGYRWWRRRSRRGGGVAEERALRQLDRVLAFHLPGRGQVGRFHSLLANVLRRYLERKCRLPARHRTTREFLGMLEACAVIPDADKEFLRQLFTSCDLAKFARADVSVEECAARAAQVRAFIQVSGQSPPAR